MPDTIPPSSAPAAVVDPSEEVAEPPMIEAPVESKEDVSPAPAAEDPPAPTPPVEAPTPAPVPAVDVAAAGVSDAPPRTRIRLRVVADLRAWWERRLSVSSGDAGPLSPDRREAFLSCLDEISSAELLEGETIDLLTDPSGRPVGALAELCRRSGVPAEHLPEAFTMRISATQIRLL